MPKLHQIIAIEEDAKNKIGSVTAMLEREALKPDSFNGLARTYRPKDEGGEPLPPEHKRVQLDARKEIDKFIKAKTELIDLTATKDWANMEARADVEVNGQVILIAVPVTHLLFLSKQLDHFRNYVEKLPTLDESEEWKVDPSTGQWRTDITTRHRTEKIVDFKTVSEATKEHPAQVAQLTKDVTVGYWDQTKLSAALPVPQKEELITKIEELLSAVKLARGKANEVEAPRQKIADTLFEYVLG
ncbi:MAG TPA: hypothetical protein VL866_24215 [Pyrinomonadaceae bacterium]|nr:hypothetical protein [Pyrinomonadaceae bacterium]